MVKTTGDLTLGLIARIVTTRPADQSPHTTRSLLRHISVVANIAVRSGWLRVSPFAIKPLGKWVAWSAPAGKRHLSRQEMAALLARLEAETQDGRTGWRLWKARRMHAMGAVAALGGLRAGELFRLHAADVDFGARIIHLVPRERRFKTHRSAAPVPMPPQLVPVLEGWLAHRLDPPIFPPADKIPWLFPGARGRGPWTSGPADAKPLDVLRDVGIRAGVKGVTWQVLRRSLATHLEAAGVPAVVIARILRHSETVDAVWYRQADVANLRDAVAGFGY